MSKMKFVALSLGELDTGMSQPMMIFLIEEYFFGILY